MERRKFIKNSALAGASAVAGTTALSYSCAFSRKKTMDSCFCIW